MLAADGRYRRGPAVMERTTGSGVAGITAELADVSPDFARMTVEFPFGDLYARDALGLKSREIAAVGALAALANAAPELRVHVAAALRLGCARAEVAEILMQTAICAGFPAALNALLACRDLLVPEVGEGGAGSG